MKKEYNDAILVSECCGASTFYTDYGLCPQCNEHCDFVEEEE